MTGATLLASAGLSLVAAALYGYVGWRLRNRTVAGDAARAWKTFVVWWVALAGSQVISAGQTLLGFANLATAPRLLVLNVLSDVAIAIALWGLLYYLLYLFTGKKNLFRPLTAFYAVFLVLILGYVGTSHAVGVRTDGWTFSLDFGQTAAQQFSNPVVVLIVAMLLLPQILGALAYLTLVFRLKDRTLRYRVFVVSVSILIWFTSPLVALGSGINYDNPGATYDAWQVLSRAIGIGAAVAILLAYLPPPWLKRRYGITSVDEATPEAGAGPVPTELTRVRWPKVPWRVPLAGDPGAQA